MRLPVPRPSRVLAVARYELRSHWKGSAGWRFLALAVVLLLPASVVPIPTPQPRTEPPAVFPPPAPIAVRGTVPKGLEEWLVPADASRFELEGSAPVRLRTPRMDGNLRLVLDQLEDQPRVSVRPLVAPFRLPGRSLLLLVLAMSLLSGPIAEALPGERARRTLDVLMSAGITRGELLGGKWAAWTAAATASAWASAMVAAWKGVQPLGLWTVAVPLYVGTAVALSLWLVRFADDVVGGTAAPMRVLPVASGAAGVLALGLGFTHPWLAAAVPLGGPLLVAADLFQSPAQAAIAALSTLVVVTALLTRTGVDIVEDMPGSGPVRFGAIGLGLLATAMWWLTLGGPAIWQLAGNPAVVKPVAGSLFAASLMLVACGIVSRARDTNATRAVASTGSHPVAGILVALSLGTLLAVAGVAPEGSTSFFAPVLERLGTGALPSRLLAGLFVDAGREAGQPTTGYEWVAAVAAIAAQAFLFRSVIAAKTSWPVASLLWCMAVTPTAPWTLAGASLALGALGAGFGTAAAFTAHLAWSLASASGATSTWMQGLESPGTRAGLAFAAQALALAIALGAAKVAALSPRRHQS